MLTKSKTWQRTRLILSALLALSSFSAIALERQEEHKASKTQTAKSKILPKPVDFSALTPFKEALLDLKGAVSVGINREDYSHKLQTAAGEELKAEDRISNQQKALSERFTCYQTAFIVYKSAGNSWDHWNLMRSPRFSSNPGIEDRICEAENELQKAWVAAGKELDICNRKSATSQP